MAIIKNGLVSGKIGNQIYYVQEGRQCSRAVSAKPTKPATANQVRYREKMTVTSKFLSSFISVIKVGWHDPDSKRKYYSNSMSYHLQHALVELTVEDNKGKSPVNHYQIDMPKVLLSSGNIESPNILSAERKENQLHLTWGTTLGPITNRLDDILAIVAYEPGRICESFISAGTRTTGTASVKLPSHMKGKLHVWTFYWNHTKQKAMKNELASDSVYLGEF